MADQETSFYYLGSEGLCFGMDIYGPSNVVDVHGLGWSQRKDYCFGCQLLLLLGIGLPFEDQCLCFEFSLGTCLNIYIWPMWISNRSKLAKSLGQEQN